MSSLPAQLGPQRPTVSEVETFPLEHILESPYGTAKGRVPARIGTLVKITTSEGFVGWGESFGPPRFVAPALEAFSRALVGQPIDIRENFAQRIVAENYHLSIGGSHIAALSGIDIALWDAQARTLGVPIGHLLGGVIRTEVPAYASIGYVTENADIDDFRAQLASAAAEGFQAAKIKIGIDPVADRQRAEAALAELGPHGELMVDYNANGTVDSVMRSLRGLLDLDPRWVEEPLPPYQHDGWERVRELGVPLAGGEALYGRFGFREPIANGHFDIIQPDAAKCGGLTEAKLISQLAYTFNRRVSPHCWGTGVAQAACLQLLSTLPDLPFGEFGGTPQFFEFDRGLNPLREGVLAEPILPANGTVAIPSGPGLGVEVDAEWARFHRVEGLFTHVASK